MPVTKNALCRYQIIDICLNSKVKRYWSLHDILDKLAENDIIISTRTLENDFDAMRFDERLGYRAPIMYCKVNRGYYYTAERFSINSLGLTEAEVRALLTACELLVPYNNLKAVHALPSLIEKIRNYTGMVAKAKTDVLFVTSSFSDDLVFNLNILMEAIEEKVVVRIVSNNLNGTNRERFFFHPWYLNEFEGHWYVVGLSDHDKAFAFLHLSLIEGIVPSEKTFIAEEEAPDEVYR